MQKLIRLFFVQLVHFKMATLMHCSLLLQCYCYYSYSSLL